MIQYGLPLEIKELDRKDRMISGFGSTFGGSPDAHNDVIAKGAFTKTLNENRTRMKYLYQHDSMQPLGTFTELKETPEGLYFRAKIANTRLGDDVLALVDEKVISENSIGFNTIKEEMNPNGYNEIQEVKLWEISAVTFGANENALMKSLDTSPVEVLKRYDILTAILRKGELTDDSYYALEYELLKLKSIYEKATQAEGPSTTIVKDSLEPTVEDLKAQLLSDMLNS